MFRGLYPLNTWTIYGATHVITIASCDWLIFIGRWPLGTRHYILNQSEKAIPVSNADTQSLCIMHRSVDSSVLSLSLSVCLSLSPSLPPSVCLSVCLSLCLLRIDVSRRNKSCLKSHIKQHIKPYHRYDLSLRYTCLVLAEPVQGRLPGGYSRPGLLRFKEHNDRFPLLHLTTTTDVLRRDSMAAARRVPRSCGKPPCTLGGSFSTTVSSELSRTLGRISPSFTCRASAERRGGRAEREAVRDTPDG